MKRIILVTIVSVAIILCTNCMETIGQHSRTFENSWTLDIQRELDSVGGLQYMQSRIDYLEKQTGYDWHTQASTYHDKESLAGRMESLESQGESLAIDVHSLHTDVAEMQREMIDLKQKLGSLELQMQLNRRLREKP